MLNRKRSTRASRTSKSNKELIILDSESEEEIKPSPKRRSTRPRKSISDTFSTFFENEEEDNEEEDEANTQRVALESARQKEINEQNEAYEKAIIADAILKIEQEEQQARRTRFQAAASRTFIQNLSPEDKQVSISVMLPSYRISKNWSVLTPFQTLLEWVSTELIKQGEDVMEDEIQLVERISPESSPNYEPSFSLEMIGITEPIVFVAQYSPHRLQLNKRQRSV
jgi:hypothetical protein